jgi:NAD(P)H-hydrate repair Nnr-like enzyme with NAD(P)H-hydrate epimerase domain
MKIFSAAQIKQIDEETIANEPISSINLMERAAMACVKRIIKLINMEDELIIFCGKGNNGGDGLAITRLLLERGFICHAHIVNYTDKYSLDAENNTTNFALSLNASNEISNGTYYGNITLTNSTYNMAVPKRRNSADGKRKMNSVFRYLNFSQRC